MITKQHPYKDILIYIVTDTQGNAFGIIGGGSKKEITRALGVSGIYHQVIKLAATYDQKKGKVLYPKGIAFLPQDYDKVIALIGAQPI